MNFLSFWENSKSCIAFFCSTRSRICAYLCMSEVLCRSYDFFYSWIPESVMFDFSNQLFNAWIFSKKSSWFEKLRSFRIWWVFSELKNLKGGDQERDLKSPDAEIVGISIIVFQPLIYKYIYWRIVHKQTQYMWFLNTTAHVIYRMICTTYFYIHVW